MLKQLRLQNIILVENADISFGAGLNILTGETGAGKSAVMNGLGLAVGDRSDAGMIRRGCDKGVVEAAFDIESHPILSLLLTESGIDHDPGQDLLIRREISQQGKNKVYINNQLAQVSLLRKLGQHLAHMVTQHANQELFTLEYHREALDTYYDLQTQTAEFRTCYNREQAVRSELEMLIKQEAQRLREIDICQSELEELAEANLKEGEDEELFAEYTLLVNSKELTEHLDTLLQSMSGERHSILSALNRNKSILDALSKIDSRFKDISQSFDNAYLELQEVTHTLNRYQGSMQSDPHRLEELNERLTLINKIKRKYGTSFEVIQQHQVETQNKLNQLQNADIRIEELKDELERLEKCSNQLAHQLTQQRHAGAKKLSQALTLQLHALNMPKAQFFVRLMPQNRTSSGDDKVEFFLQANAGENEIPLREAASGGEVSRVLLALRALLAGKEKIPTLIFDEVDANIGGETASIVGEKLREVAQQHQVICVTHFPQVASRADHHLQIRKQDKEGRTVTEVQRLDAQSQQKELERMLGGRR